MVAGDQLGRIIGAADRVRLQVVESQLGVFFVAGSTIPASQAVAEVDRKSRFSGRIQFMPWFRWWRSTGSTSGADFLAVAGWFIGFLLCCPSVSGTQEREVAPRKPR